MEYQDKYEKIVKNFESYVKTIRTDILDPRALHDVSVNIYGNKVKLLTLATISVDKNNYIIDIWNIDSINAIQKALIEYDATFNPRVDKKTIIINVPPMTYERKENMVKSVSNKEETYKQSILSQRKDDRRHIEQMNLSEDEEKIEKNKLQKIVDINIEKLNKISEEKKKHILC